MGLHYNISISQWDSRQHTFPFFSLNDTKLSHKYFHLFLLWECEERKWHDVQSVLEVLVGAEPTSAEEVSISFRPNSSFCSHDLSYSSTGEKHRVNDISKQKATIHDYIYMKNYSSHNIKQSESYFHIQHIRPIHHMKSNLKPTQGPPL